MTPSQSPAATRAPHPVTGNAYYEKKRHEFVYLILSYGSFDQTVRLIRTIRTSSPEAAIVLHHDAKSPLPSAVEMADLKDVYLVEPRVLVTWGDGSFLDATLASLHYLWRCFEFSWVTTLSGQDYPLRPLNCIEDELRQAEVDAFVRAFPATREHYAYRYFMRYRRLPRFPYAHRIPSWLRAALWRGVRKLNASQTLIRIEGGARGSPHCIGIRSSAHPFSNGFACFKGSDWFTVNHRSVAHLLEFERRHPEALAYFRRTFIPSESYVPTVLTNCKELRTANDNRRYVSWDVPGAAHPKILTIDDLAAMTQSAKDFARKFDAGVDSSVLDELDRVIFETEPHQTSEHK